MRLDSRAYSLVDDCTRADEFRERFVNYGVGLSGFRRDFAGIDGKIRISIDSDLSQNYK
jgi:hypothetical protein